MKVSVLTLGCKVNQSESSLIESDFRNNGWNIVDLSENPDYCIINTCSVTSKSDYQSRQLIRRASNSGIKVIVTGCYSELNKDFLKHFNGVTMLIENRDKLNIAQKLTGISPSGDLDYAGYSKSRFFLKIQDGCNNSCSYCVIPSSRGISKSLKKEDVIYRVKRLSAYFNEVVLTGIHLGSYGYDMIPKVSLSELLKDILLQTPIKRIRLSSLEINEIDADLLKIIENPRICNHLHIPMQSGDDNILRNMKRNYNSREFISGIININEKIPGISIGTDIIAGFPGEGEKEFRNTEKMLRSLPFSYAHIFPYSSRPATEAAEMTDNISPFTKKSRCAILRDIDRIKRAEYMKHQIGQRLDMLVEDVHENIAVGITGNYLKMKSYTRRTNPRELVAVRVTGIENNVLVGNLIEEM